MEGLLRMILRVVCSDRGLLHQSFALQHYYADMPQRRIAVHASHLLLTQALLTLITHIHVVALKAILVQSGSTFYMLVVCQPVSHPAAQGISDCPSSFV